jgi:hypothetical protein
MGPRFREDDIEYVARCIRPAGRHGRIYSGHPRLDETSAENVDGRVEPGHDENNLRLRLLWASESAGV